MITIIAGTNREGSKTLGVAKNVERICRELQQPVQLLDLRNLPADFSSTWMSDRQSPDFQKIVDTYVRSASKFIIVVPEYQGTFPGIMKMFIDALHPRDLRGKKAALVGVGAGRAGNLRGIDHLAASFHYLGIHVYPSLLPLSRIEEITTTEGEITDPAAIRSITTLAEGFGRF